MNLNNLKHPKMLKNPDLIAICYCDFACPGARQEEVVWITKSGLEAPDPYNFGRTLDETFDHFTKTYSGYQFGSSKPWRFWMEDIDGKILRDTGSGENARTMQAKRNELIKQFHQKTCTPEEAKQMEDSGYYSPFWDHKN